MQATFSLHACTREVVRILPAVHGACELSDSGEGLCGVQQSWAAGDTAARGARLRSLDSAGDVWHVCMQQRLHLGLLRTPACAANVQPVKPTMLMSWETTRKSRDCRQP